MGSSELQCPNCGAPAPFRGTTVTLVCEYCNSTIVRTGVDLSLLGNVSAITDNGSPVLLGGRGTHRGAAFEIVGRLQISHGRGFWNEWFLEFSDGSEGWLADALGQFSVVRPVATTEHLPRFDELKVGNWVPLLGNAHEFAVTDRRAGRYRGSEGVLPFEAYPGCTFFSVDLRDPNGNFATLDFGEDRRGAPQIYAGHATDLQSMRLTPLRVFEGWERLTSQEHRERAGGSDV